MTGSYASCKREYDELLAEIFEQYFVLIRTIGWRFMPELQITSWVTDEQAEGKVSARVSALESEWGFLSSLQPKLQAVVPPAERHFITVSPTTVGVVKLVVHSCCVVASGLSSCASSDRA